MVKIDFWVLIVIFIAAVGMVQPSFANSHDDSDDDSSDDDSDDDSSDDDSDDDSSDDDSDENKDEHIFNADVDVSKNEAVIIAQDFLSGALVEIEQGYEKGILVWEVKLLDRSTGQMHEIKVDAQTGDIVDVSYDYDDENRSISDDSYDNNFSDDDSDDKSSDDISNHSFFEVIIDYNTKISGQKAIDIAKDNVNGTLIELEQGYEEGILVWKAKITDNQKKYEVYIDADTGGVVKIQSENILQEKSTQGNLSVEDTADLEERISRIEEKVSFFEKVLRFLGFTE